MEAGNFEQPRGTKTSYYMRSVISDLQPLSIAPRNETLNDDSGNIPVFLVEEDTHRSQASNGNETSSDAFSHERTSYETSSN